MIPLGRFRPTLRSTLALAGALALFGALGQWQWQRAAAKRAVQNELEARAALPAVPLAGEVAAAADGLRFRRVVAHGRYEAERQLFLDNRIHRGQAGYHVLTPLKLAGGETRVLIDRGWIAGGPDRSRLPEVATPDGPVTVEGLAVVPSRRYFALAPEAPGWRPVRQNLDLDWYRAQGGVPVLPVVIRLDAASGAGGFVRDWPRPAEGAERNVSYALQWWGFGLAAAGIWFFVNWRRT